MFAQRKAAVFFIFLFLVLSLPSVSTAGNILFRFLDKLTGNDMRAEVMPSMPNPVVYEIKRPIESIIDRLKTVLRNADYTEIINEERSDRSYTITAYQRTGERSYEWADTVRGRVTIKIIPSEDREGEYLMTVKGEVFEGFVYYKHMPPHRVTHYLTKQIEKAFSPAFIVSDSKKVDNTKFYIGSTDFTVDDIEGVEVYNSSIANVPDFENLVQYIGGYASIIGKEKIVVRFSKGRNKVGALGSVLDFYKFRTDDTVQRDENGVSLKTVITLRDGKQITIPYYREDIFRKRL